MRTVLLVSIFIFASSAFLQSQQGSERRDDGALWTIVLRSDAPAVIDSCTGRPELSFQTWTRPTRKPPEGPFRDDRIVFSIWCESRGDSICYVIPAHMVDTVSSDATVIRNHQSIGTIPIQGCCRDRVGWWMFDKVELRLMLAWRRQTDSAFYPTAGGGAVHIGRPLFLGGEAALMWGFDARGQFHLGILTGVWGIDSSLFVPLGAHLRYSFTPRQIDFEGCCNTFFVYADAGVPIGHSGDTAQGFGKYWKGNRYFAGGGIGYDWGGLCDLLGWNVDLSLDVGARVVTVPLPPVDCCPDVPSVDRRYPYRTSLAGIVRLGFTW